MAAKRQPRPFLASACNRTGAGLCAVAPRQSVTVQQPLNVCPDFGYDDPIAVAHDGGPLPGDHPHLLPIATH